MTLKFSTDAGSLALNFVNTVEERIGYRQGMDPPPEKELLRSYLDWLAWCSELKVVPAVTIKQLKEACSENQIYAEKTLKSVLSLREVIFRLCTARVLGQTPNPDDLLDFNRFLKSQPVLQLSCKSKELLLAREQTTDRLLCMIPPIIDDAAHVLTSPNQGRLRICAMPDCGWIFLDTSKNGKRRWCDMNDCGNRFKAKRFYDRNH